MPLDGERRDVKAGALQAVDIPAEVAPAHLEGLNHFAIEIGGRLDEFGQRRNFKRRIFFDRAAGEVADPTGLERPGFFRVQPLRAVCENTALHLEADGIEFDHAEAAEEFLRGIEDVVVVDLGVVPENPALRASVGLGGPAFDLVAQRVLALVGVGKISVVEDEESAGQHNTR